MLLYIDPGTSGLIINFLIAVFSSVIYFFRKLFFRKLVKKSSNQHDISLFSEGNQYKNTFLPIIIQLIFLLLIGEKLIASTTGLLKTCKVGTITASVVTLVMKR